MVIVFEDTGEEMVLDENSQEVVNHFVLGDGAWHTLGENVMEGRERTTYWMDAAKKEAYRLECLRKVNGAS